MLGKKIATRNLIWGQFAPSIINADIARALEARAENETLIEEASANSITVLFMKSPLEIKRFFEGIPELQTIAAPATGNTLADVLTQNVVDFFAQTERWYRFYLIDPPSTTNCYAGARRSSLLCWGLQSKIATRCCFWCSQTGSSIKPKSFSTSCKQLLYSW